LNSSQLLSEYPHHGVSTIIIIIIKHHRPHHQNTRCTSACELRQETHCTDACVRWLQRNPLHFCLRATAAARTALC
jgi:hypothetical protein